MTDPRSVDAAVRRRLHEMERLLGVVAHRLGAVILPTLGAPTESADRRVRRLEMIASTLSDHVVREKRALDIVRGHRQGELERADEAEWNELVPGVLQGLAPSCARLSVALSTDAPIDLHVTRAITTMVIVLDEQLPEASEVEVEVEASDRSLSLSARWSPEAVIEVPAALTESWDAVGEFEIAVTPGGASVSGSMRDVS